MWTERHRHLEEQLQDALNYQEAMQARPLPLILLLTFLLTLPQPSHSLVVPHYRLFPVFLIPGLGEAWSLGEGSLLWVFWEVGRRVPRVDYEAYSPPAPSLGR